MNSLKASLFVIRAIVLSALLAALLSMNHFTVYQSALLTVFYVFALEVIVALSVKKSLSTTILESLNNWTSLLLVCLLGIVAFWFKCLMMPLRTLAFAFQLSGLLVASLVGQIQLSSGLEECQSVLLKRLAQEPIIVRGTIIGAWLGALLSGLDWNEPWQAWPGPCAIGSILGHLLGCLIDRSVSWSREVK